MQWTISTTTFKHMERTREQQLVWKNTHLAQVYFQGDAARHETYSNWPKVNGTKVVPSSFQSCNTNSLTNKNPFYNFKKRINNRRLNKFSFSTKR